MKTILLLSQAVWSLGVAACVEHEPGGAPVDDVVAPDGSIGQVDGPFVEWLFCEGDCVEEVRGSISLREVACSASISCSDALLFDEQLNRRPTITTGFGCMFPTEQPADALLGFHPNIRCYDDGDPAAPSTWLPLGGIEPPLPVTSHLFFASADNTATAGPGSGRSWLDAARRLSTFAGHKFCELHAYGWVAFSDADSEPRKAYHEHFAPVVEWRAVVEAEVEALPYDCHTDPGDLAYVRRRVVASVTHDRPDNVVKGTFPATHDIVMIDDDERLTAVVAEGSTFPEDADGAPVPFIERVLDAGGTLAADWTCADISGGVVQDVAVHLDGLLGGAIVVKRSVTDLHGTRHWDCERDLADRCIITPDLAIGLVAPCLLPVVLTGP